MAGTQRQTLAADVTVLHKRMALFTVAVLRMPLHMMIFLHKMCVGTGDMRSLLMFMMVFVVMTMIVLMLVGVAAMILEIYVAIALGHLANKHRIAMSFVWFVVLQTVLSFLTGLAAMALGYSPFFPAFYANLSAHGMMWMMILPCLIEAAVFYFGTTWILKNKLNLE